MKKKKLIIRPEYYSQLTIEGGEIFALEGIGLSIAGGWRLCHQFSWHWLVGVVVGVCVLAGFMWSLSMKITRQIIFGLNALAAGLLSYLLATVLFNATDLTGGFIGVLTAVIVAIWFVRRFEVFKHDLTVYQNTKERQHNQMDK